MACGGLHTIVLNHEGELYTWGSTEGGQLGLNPNIKEETVLEPQRIEKLAKILSGKN